MPNTTATPHGTWTSTQAYVIAAICLSIGIAGGWFLRSVRAASSKPQATPQAIVPSATSPAVQGPTPEQVNQIADTQAAPLLEQLKSDPRNADLLANLGNIYYDAQQYSTAIDYYGKSLELQPARAEVRTDMATAYWYLGKPDDAIREFNKALSYQPNNANALFNLGIVKWQGKMDAQGALATWQQLLNTNPSYENREKVLALIDQVRKHANLKPKQTGDSH